MRRGTGVRCSVSPTTPTRRRRKCSLSCSRETAAPTSAPRLDSGHDVGSVSGYLYESLPASVRSRFVLPPEISRISDYELKYLVILRLALGASDITYLGSPNPSTFLRLLEVLDEHRETLAR